MPFAPGTTVDVKQLDDTTWTLHSAVSYEGSHQRFEAPADMTTDFASVPRVFIWLLPTYGRYTQAAIVHDYLWRERPHGISLHDADGLFRRMMRELNVPYLRRWLMWAAVRWGAILKPGGLNAEWLKDLPLVLFYTLLVLPIVLPPAALILVSLIAFYAMELVWWVVLWVAKLVARPIHKDRPDKQVTVPELSMKS